MEDPEIKQVTVNYVLKNYLKWNVCIIYPLLWQTQPMHLLGNSELPNFC